MSQGDFGELAGRTVNVLRQGAEEETRLILATTKGDMARQVRWMREADCGSSSVEWEVPTPGSALQELATGDGLRAQHVVSTACTSGLVALIEGAIGIADGTTSPVMTVGADVVTDFVRDGFTALKALSPTMCRPFDKDRNGLALGSAAAGCLLRAGADHESLAVVSGFGISNDATHMTAPDRNAGGLVRAIQGALSRAGLEPRDIDVVFAHGTGTRYNDAMESLAIERVFLKAGASPAVTAVKGLLGHTLGAAGMIEAALAVEMLRRQVILPVVHLQTAEHPGIDFVTRARRAKIRHVLKIASGFGGMNAAVVLSAPGGDHASCCGMRGTVKANVIAAAGVSDDRFRSVSAKCPRESEHTSPDPVARAALRVLEPLVGRIPSEKRATTGLVLGTTLGCLETDREFDRSRREHNGRYASPAAFSRTLPSTVAAELALKFQLTGPSVVVSSGDSSAAVAIRRAVAWMRDFGLDYCITGGIDWIGPRVGTPEGKRVVLLLLGREGHLAVAGVTIGEESVADLSARRDESLDGLWEWVGAPKVVTIHGIHFSPRAGEST